MMRTPLTQLLLAALAALACDQLSKYLLLYTLGLADGPPVELTPFFSLVMVWNKGVSFGMFSRAGHDWAPYALIAVALGISVLLARLALASPHRAERLAYGLVIGGALGNVVDRLYYGAVADFFLFHWRDWAYPAFNIADSAIFIGVCILLLRMFKNPKMPA